MGNDETPRPCPFSTTIGRGQALSALTVFWLSLKQLQLLSYFQSGMESFDSVVTLLSSKVCLDNDLLRFVCLRHWFRVNRLFNRKPQSLGLAEQIASQGDYCCIRKDRSSSL